MFDERLIGYIILKCVAAMDGKRGRGTVDKILRGSSSKPILMAIKKFDLEGVAGILRHIPKAKVDEIIERLLRKKFLYISYVQIEDYSYPMIFISEDGQDLLDSYAATEEGKLSELREQAIEIGAGVVYMDSNSIVLDRFLLNTVKILNWLNAHRKEDIPEGNILEGDITEEEIRRVLKIDDRLWEQCTMFFDTLLLGLGKGEWYHHANVERLNYRFHKGIRTFLGNVPEIQAAAFRVHYGIKDMFYHTQEELIEYYGLQPEDLQDSLKKVLKKLFHKKWKRKNWIVKDITNVLFGEQDIRSIADEDDNDEDNATRLDTYTQTLMLYKQGYSVDDIAQMRDLRKSTIMGHFARLISEYGLDPYEFVDRERVKIILEVAKQVGVESLKVIKDSLPDDYEYGEISIALAIGEEEIQNECDL